MLLSQVRTHAETLANHPDRPPAALTRRDRVAERVLLQDNHRSGPLRSWLASSATAARARRRMA